MPPLDKTLAVLFLVLLWVVLCWSWLDKDNIRKP